MNKKNVVSRRTDQVQTTYELLSVNLEERTGVFRMRNELPKRSPWTKINVSLSGLLVHMIENDKTDDLYIGQSFIKTQFTSAIDSKEISDNPFQLVKFVPSNRSDIPENYQLKYVTEKYSQAAEIKDAMGNRMRKMKWRKHNVYNLRRFREVIVEGLMKDQENKEGFTFVKP